MSAAQQMMRKDTDISRVASARPITWNWSQLANPLKLNLLSWQEEYDIADDPTDGAVHRHGDFYSLYLITSGTARYVLNEHLYASTRGDVYMVPPGVVHSRSHAEHVTQDVFYFRAAIFRPGERAILRSSSGLRNLLVSPQHNHARGPKSPNLRLRLPTQYFERAAAMSVEIRDELGRAAGGDIASPHIARASFFRLVAHLARWSMELESMEIAKERDGGVEGILRYCDEHFHEPLPVAQLAARMFVSESYFHELFKREVGVSPAAYIRRIRLAHAQTLLRTTKRRPGDIARECGFKNISQFSRAFSHSFGIAPREYREQFAGYG